MSRQEKSGFILVRLRNPRIIPIIKYIISLS